MEKSSQIAWRIVPLRHFFPLKVVPLIEGLLEYDIVVVPHHIGYTGNQVVGTTGNPSP
jgi:hypothetical protein